VTSATASGDARTRRRTSRGGEELQSLLLREQAPAVRSDRLTLDEVLLRDLVDDPRVRSILVLFAPERYRPLLPLVILIADVVEIGDEDVEDERPAGDEGVVD